MKFSISAILALAALATAAVIEDPNMASVRREVLLLERQGQNAGRPVPQGGCCAKAANLKQDICKTAAGQSGKCVPDSINGCGEQLTCIADTALVCDPTKQERGKAFCRRKGVTARVAAAAAGLEAAEED